MRPRLYTAEETQFDTNGIGVLFDAIACKTSLAFGQDELTMQYPVEGVHYDQIRLRSILVAKPDQYRDPQPYRVYQVTAPLSGVVTVRARHLVYDLSGIAVQPFFATGVGEALQGLKANAVTDCPFDFWTDKVTAGAFSVPVPDTIWQRLGGIAGSILDVYGGEYQFDGYTVKLYNHLGADRGVSIRYGKNLTSLEQDANCAACYTGVMPYWVNPETGAVVKLADNVIMASGQHGYVRILPLDLSAEFEAAPTEDQLRARAERYMADNKIGEPAVSWKVEFVALDQTVEYKGKALLERIYLGDTVEVQFAAMGISAKSRAIAAVYDCLMERYDSITLGSLKQTLSTTIVEQQKQIDRAPTLTDMERVSAALTKSILGANGGSVRLLDTDGDGRPDELYIADNDDPAQAQKVWRFNYEGWAASKTGYNGPFELGATLSNGIIANFITAGSLSAALITTGILQSPNGSFRFNMETGDIYIGGYATDADINNLSAEMANQTKDLQSAMDSITHIKLDAEGLLVQVQNIIANGVDQVITKTGYRFDAMGLLISKMGEEIANRIDNTGMYVERSGTVMLQANAGGVITTDLTVRNYLKIAHARFEAYGAGATACFWMQFASGQNILLDSGRTITNNDYNTATYTPSSPLVEGETYTVSLCVTPAPGVTLYSVFLSSGWIRNANLYVQGLSRQVIRATFVAHYLSGKTPTDSASYAQIRLCRSPNDGTVTDDSIVHWCKVEIGDTPTDWSPAPED